MICETCGETANVKEVSGLSLCKVCREEFRKWNSYANKDIPKKRDPNWYMPGTTRVARPHSIFDR